MGERPQMLRAEDMATTSTAVTTLPPQLEEESVERVAVITLRPTRAQTRKKVVWTEDTVDNENMNKKKSKCCCIYEKPHRFDESDSSDSEDECEHCFGHVERRHKKPSTSTTTEESAPEPTTTVSLQPPAPASEPAPAPEPGPAPPDKPPADS